MRRILFDAKHKAKQSWRTLRMNRPLFVGHVVGSRPMKKRKTLQRMIKLIVFVFRHTSEMQTWFMAGVGI